MKLRHTKGRWHQNREFCFVEEQEPKDGVPYTPIGQVFKRLDDDAERANADFRLICFSAIGLEVAINTYLSLLQLPPDTWRIQNQQIYVGLRNYIADATGYTEQQVQEFCERVASLIKYEKITVEQAWEKASK